MNAPTQAGLPALPLKDPQLFRTQCYIDGEWVGHAKSFAIVNPATGAELARVPDLGAAETRRAIDAAERAMESPLPAHKRAEILVRVAGYLGRRHEEVARLISDEAGKPLKAARV
jgi:succinate-semialdehyde dehydrogenase/glutarate-semialdehyde dehydrogenase